MKNISKIINVRAFIYAFLIWLNLNITGIQNIYFSEGNIVTVIVVKILHLFFLYAIFSKMHSLYTNRHVPKVKQEIIISSIYLFILAILLICVWPGAWGSDDISVLRNAEWYILTPWQHFFSGLFQILCLQTIPIPSGVIIVQIIIASLIVGYCISNIANLYGKNKKQIRILEVVFSLILLLPPLVLYILSGFRMGMYSYFELALITKLIILYKEQKKITIRDILKISFLTIIVSCWRTEGIYYPFFILILYFILGKKIVLKKVAISTFLIVIVVNISTGKLNNTMIENTDYSDNPTMKYNGYNIAAIKSNNYSLTATMEPITQLIKISNDSDKEEVNAINKVLDVEYILEHPKNSGETNFWNDGVVREYSDKEYSDYLKAYMKLAIKYPDVTFKSMWNIFVKAGSGMGQNSKQTTRNMVSFKETLSLFELNSKPSIKWNAVTSRVAKYTGPININIRNTVINFLNGTDSNFTLTIIHNIFWNLLIPFTLMLFCLIYKIIKKDWFMVFLIFTVTMRIPIVFITAPAEYFMYYLSAYLCSYVISAIVIFEIIINKRKNNSVKLFDKKSLLYTFLIWFNLNILGIQNIYFTQNKNIITEIVKVFHFIFLYFIIDKIRTLYVNRHQSKTKNEIIIGIIYFLILISLLVLVWPGIWNIDDINLLRNAEIYSFTSGQHFFSAIFQMLCLQTIPIPSGVMIVQALIAALIVGHCIANVSTLYGKNNKQVIIIQVVLGLITLLPPLLVYILSGTGIGIYSYLELALVTQILILYKNKKEVTFFDILKISILTIIISCWRIEGIYYPLFILFLYFILGKKVIRKKVAITAFLIIMCINCLIGTINYLAIGSENNNINTDTNTLDLFTVNTKTWVKWNTVTSKVARFKTPININIRNNVILFLSERNMFWNLYIPFGLILISLIYKLIKKDWFMVLLILAVITRIPILFTTTDNFMYYLSTYLCAYMVSFIVILEFIINLINKKSKDNVNEENKELVVYKKSKKEIVKKIFKQFLSFVLVSGVGWIIDFSIYFALTHFANFKVVFANIISSIPAITYVFIMSNKGIFKNIDSKLSLKVKYLIYFGYQLLLLLSISLLGEFLYDKLVNLITLELLLNNLKIFIKILITPITMTLNFIVMKNLIEKI